MIKWLPSHEILTKLFIGKNMSDVITCCFIYYWPTFLYEGIGDIVYVWERKFIIIVIDKRGKRNKMIIADYWLLFLYYAMDKTIMLFLYISVKVGSNDLSLKIFLFFLANITDRLAQASTWQFRSLKHSVLIGLCAIGLWKKKKNLLNIW